jgi:hypothetical protein
MNGQLRTGQQFAAGYVNVLIDEHLNLARVAAPVHLRLAVRRKPWTRIPPR